MRRSTREEKQVWYVNSYQEALNVRGRTTTDDDVSENIPMASPIFGVQRDYRFGFESSEEDQFKTLFPHQQLIRGDGACYFNACIAGILNKCVGNPRKWALFKQDLINKGFGEIALAICEDDKQFPTRQKVNDLLQVRGERNIVRRLSKEILIPLHQVFIRNRVGKIYELFNRKEISPEIRQQIMSIITEGKLLTGSISEEEIASVNGILDSTGFLTKESVGNIITSFKAHLQNIRQYYNEGRNEELATKYNDSDVEPIIKELFTGVEIISLTREIFLQQYLRNVSPISELQNSEAIYLWNPSGDHHFDLLYGENDAVTQEIRRLQAVAAAVQNSATQAVRSQVIDTAATNASQTTDHQHRKNQDKLWKIYNRKEEISPISEPSTKIKVLNVEPVLSEEKNIWINDDRGNKFRVMNGIYDAGNQRLEIGRVFIGILQKIKDEITDKSGNEIVLNKKQILAIIDAAKTKGGISNKLENGEYVASEELRKIAGVDPKIAKHFSARFQQECEKCGIYTGREDENGGTKGVKMVGLRLTFIPDDVVDYIRENKPDDFTKNVVDVQKNVENKLKSQRERR